MKSFQLGHLRQLTPGRVGSLLVLQLDNHHMPKKLMAMELKDLDPLAMLQDFLVSGCMVPFPGAMYEL